MSRIGKLPIVLSDKVEVTLNGNDIKVKWPLGELSFTHTDSVEVKKEDNNLVVNPIWNDSSALWWTTRAVLNNMVEWVSTWFTKSLEISWVGYKFEVSWTKLILSVGFSHKIEVEIPKWLEINPDEKAKNTIHIKWIDKQFVGEFAAKVRAIKKPEPYKGKWIKYVGEYVRRKSGKAGSK